MCKMTQCEAVSTFQTQKKRRQLSSRCGGASCLPLPAFTTEFCDVVRSFLAPSDPEAPACQHIAAVPSLLVLRLEGLTVPGRRSTPQHDLLTMPLRHAPYLGELTRWASVRSLGMSPMVPSYMFFINWR